MRILSVISAIFLIGCYGTGAKPDTTGVDSAVVSSPAVQDTAPRADTGTVPPGGELQLRTDRTTYRGGEQMTLTLVNPTSNSYAYNPCTRLLEREVSGAWIELQEMRVCTMIAHILAPRSSRTETTELTKGLEPGRYRVVLLLGPQRRGGADRVRLSAPITVSR